MPGKWGGARRARPPPDPPMVTVDSDNYVTRDTYGLLPPASCGKVMFLHLSVILPTGGSVTPEQTPPWADNPPAQCMLGYGQQAGGTHTGIHYCCL